jgi:hypothetical protein
MDQSTAYLMGIEYFEWGFDLFKALDSFDTNYPDSSAHRFSVMDGWESAKEGNI